MRAACALAITLAAYAEPSLTKAQQTREVVVRDNPSLRHALAEAAPGTAIVLAPGDYQPWTAQRLRGTPEKPIVVRSADPARPARISGGQTGIHLREVTHVELHDLLVEGCAANGINIDDGDSGHPSRFLRLERLTVRQIGDQGNNDGIKLSGVQNFTVSGCVVERWGGSGSAIDLVGCQDGLIVDSSFTRDDDSPNANGVQAKGGSARVSIERCRFQNAGGRAVNLGGSTGADYFRPRDAKAEATDLALRDSTIIGSLAAVAFVGVDGAIVERNRIERPLRWAFRILQENNRAELTPCRNGTFRDNVIVFHSNEMRTPINVGPGTAPQSFTLERNRWYCVDRPDRSRPDQPITERDGVYGERPAGISPPNTP